MTRQDRWEEYGRGLTVPAVLVTFGCAWWYCVSTYGFLFGFGLGWLPAAILAMLVGAAVWIAWPLALAVLGLGLLYGIMAVGSLLFGW